MPVQKSLETYWSPHVYNRISSYLVTLSRPDEFLSSELSSVWCFLRLIFLHPCVYNVTYDQVDSSWNCVKIWFHSFIYIYIYIYMCVGANVRNCHVNGLDRILNLVMLSPCFRWRNLTRECTCGNFPLTKEYSVDLLNCVFCFLVVHNPAMSIPGLINLKKLPGTWCGTWLID